MALEHLAYIAEIQRAAPMAAVAVPAVAVPAAAVPAAKRRGVIGAVWDARDRLFTFAANGFFVFAFGVGVQFVLIHYAGMSHVPSYIIQTVLSVQLNFLLSRYLTWRDRDVDLPSALLRFNAQQLAATGVGMAFYAGLDYLGMNYIVGNVVVTAILTPLSFLIGHHWSMSDRARPAAGAGRG
jgi:putative flippase GtrA